MMTASQIFKYGIAATFDNHSAVDELFSGDGNDPSLAAENLAYDVAEGGYWDISVAIGANGTCVTQILIFRNKEGYEAYKKDGVTIFDQKEI